MAKKLTAEDLATEIAIMIDYDGPGCLSVYPNPEADHIMACPPRMRNDYHFTTKAAAELWAQREVERLKKLGYTSVDWCCNY